MHFEKRFLKPFGGALIVCATLGTASSVQAEDKPTPIDLAGFVDTYYSYKFNKTDDLLRNFDTSHNALSLNYLELALEQKPSADHRLGFRADLGYGPTADAVNSFDPYEGTGILVQQAYLSYLPSDKVQIDAGRFVTQHGAEVIETKDNWNYSRSLLFALAIPYYHLGARVTVNASDKFAFSASVCNGWNNIIENNTGKTFGVQGILKPSSKLTVVQNFMVGPELEGTNDDSRFLSDTVVTLAATSKVSVMGNFDYGKQGEQKWMGVAAYAKLQANDKWAFIPRFEWLDDDDTFMTGTSQSLKEITLTVENKIAGGLLARAEFRRDFSNEDFFEKDDGSLTKSQSGVSFGLVYAFGGKLGQ